MKFSITASATSICTRQRVARFYGTTFFIPNRALISITMNDTLEVLINTASQWLRSDGSMFNIIPAMSLNGAKLVDYVCRLSSSSIIAPAERGRSKLGGHLDFVYTVPSFYGTYHASPASSLPSTNSRIADMYWRWQKSEFQKVTLYLISVESCSQCAEYIDYEHFVVAEQFHLTPIQRDSALCSGFVTSTSSISRSHREQPVGPVQAKSH